MAYDPNAPNVNNAYQLDVEQIRENLNQLRVHETVASAGDIDSLPGLAPGMIIYVSSEKAYYGIFTDNLGNPMKVKLLTETGADKLDGYDAGNASGQIPVSNGTLNTNLNADMVDGYHVGTATNQIPLSQNVVHDPLGKGLIFGQSLFYANLSKGGQYLLDSSGGRTNLGNVSPGASDVGGVLFLNNSLVIGKTLKVFYVDLYADGAGFVVGLTIRDTTGIINFYYSSTESWLGDPNIVLSLGTGTYDIKIEAVAKNTTTGSSTLYSIRGHVWFGLY